MSVAEGESARVLTAEIETLLHKQAIRVVHGGESHQGFYSRYLRVLNRHLRKYSFKMLTHKVLCRSIRPGDWFVTIDLADAYFHIDIYPSHRKFLRFAYRGTAYEFQTIPFGLSLAPRVFTKCVEAALFPLRDKGIRILSYIDNYLICSSSRGQAIKDAEIVLNHLRDLGFRINMMKSRLVPSQHTEYLGLNLDSLSYRVTLTEERVASFTQCLARFQRGRVVSYKLCLRMLGLMASVVAVVHLGLLKMNDFQRWIARLRLCSRQHLSRPVRVNHACVEALRHWKAPVTLRSGIPLRAVSSRVTMTTDASLKGWGATLMGRADRVERHTASVSPGDSRSGDLEQRDRLTVQGKSPLRGVETPSSGGEPGMAEVRSGCRRSLRLARKTLSSVFLSGGRKCTVGCGCSGPSVAGRASVCISPSELNLPHFSQSEGAVPVIDSDSPMLAIPTLGGGDSPTIVGAAVAPPPTGGPFVSGGRGDLPSSSGHVSPLGLARERWNLNAAGLPSSVIHTIQSARASSTRALYNNKWRVFEEWCGRRVIIPFQCSVRDILCFLQDLLDKRKAFSTIKVYLAAISACHVGFGNKSAGQHPLISRFMEGAHRLWPVSRRLVPLWDLPIVLEALSRHPFEPMEAVSLKYLSLKMALLLALVTAKRVSDLHALSVSQSCLQFAPGLTKVTFRPNPAFVPKVLESTYRCPSTELAAFQPPSFSSPEERRLHTLCPVRALHVYVDRTAGFRTCEQLFVSWATPHTGKPLSRQRLSHWIVEAISVAYGCRGLQPPEGLRAHSTRGMAMSWALLRGVSVLDICSAACRLDVGEPSLAHAVLGAGTTVPVWKQ
ncbi:uncharacterized protein LOC113652359 [Tachysurus fulvidraco]|uniref:uncharacterized protein LOC113652359 n=1 Tax=Tachysurus fulvidraco TaxID=1234273 RepID=UPI001FEE4E36|nr:uncharacterized protein LOC113652359 [Tachysurus fulvidraco]